MTLARPPVRSPDLEALDYLSSGYVRSKASETRPANIEDLDEFGRVLNGFLNKQIQYVITCFPSQL